MSSTFAQRPTHAPAPLLERTETRSTRPPVAVSTQPWWNTVRKLLLGCGVASSVLYIGTEVYAWSQFPGYSPISFAFSELLAEGAPTRALMVAVAGAPYNLLVAALGVGVWMSSGGRVQRVNGALLVTYAVISYLGGTVFQMDPREAEGSRAHSRTRGPRA